MSYATFDTVAHVVHEQRVMYQGQNICRAPGPWLFRLYTMFPQFFIFVSFLWIVSAMPSPPEQHVFLAASALEEILDRGRPLLGILALRLRVYLI